MKSAMCVCVCVCVCVCARALARMYTGFHNQYTGDFGPFVSFHDGTIDFSTGIIFLFIKGGAAHTLLLAFALARKVVTVFTKHTRIYRGTHVCMHNTCTWSSKRTRIYRGMHVCIAAPFRPPIPSRRVICHPCSCLLNRCHEIPEP